MAEKKNLISGTGCALADFLYTGVRFDSPQFTKYLSKNAGDGGLSPGKLVFTEELEKFSGMNYSVLLNVLTGNRQPDSFNVGGPGLVSFIHASQMLYNEDLDVRFYGTLGNDDTADKIFGLLKNTPLNTAGYKKRSTKPTACTDVLSDPDYADGNGERTFINSIGAASDFIPEMLDQEFFDSQIICFGGTALVPQIHDNLSILLQRAKRNDAITLVNTVFDFRNEKKCPEKQWPLVQCEDDFSIIDVLITDKDEALRISGKYDLHEAAQYFIEKSVSSFFITNGPDDIFVFSNGKLFNELNLSLFPVSRMVTSELRDKGDTTGCGDNFVGGVLTSLALQINKKRGTFDPLSALSWAVASGGFACSYVGGAFFENSPGEKLKIIEEFRSDYLKQISYL